MTSMTIDWHGAYLSEAFRKAKKNRLKFVLPALTLFIAMFVGLFTLQSYGKVIGQMHVIGYVDLGFLVVMFLFPFTGLLGFLFTKYTERYVYPYESEVIREYGSLRDKERLITSEAVENRRPVMSGKDIADGVG